MTTVAARLASPSDRAQGAWAAKEELDLGEPEPVTKAHRTLSDLVLARLHRQIVTDALPTGR